MRGSLLCCHQNSESSMITGLAGGLHKHTHATARNLLIQCESLQYPAGGRQLNRDQAQFLVFKMNPSNLRLRGRSSTEEKRSWPPEASWQQARVSRPALWRPSSKASRKVSLKISSNSLPAAEQVQKLVEFRSETLLWWQAAKICLRA